VIDGAEERDTVQSVVNMWLRKEVMKKVRFEVLTAVSINVAVFWIVVPCSLVEV
jgi:hypothetical protein